MDAFPYCVPRGLEAEQEVVVYLKPSGGVNVQDENGKQELHRGDVVILDNNTTHFHEEVLSAIEATGAWIMYLPAYSPDLNPIEQC